MVENYGDIVQWPTSPDLHIIPSIYKAWVGIVIDTLYDCLDEEIFFVTPDA